MRDTTKVRVMRVEDTLIAMADTLRKGRSNHVIERVKRARQAAELAAAPVFAPAHGAEFARAMLFFADQLAINGERSDKLTAEMGKQFDDQGVIWRPQDQVRAAHKQIGRLRSDVLKATPNAKAIPTTSLVYAADPADFIGTTYERLEGATLPMKASYNDPLKIRTRGRIITVPVAALRYVEGRMIRVR